MVKIERIRKRDGRIVPFESEKIKNAILKAFAATETGDGEIAKNLTKQVTEILEKKYADKIPGVEGIQDTVEEVLIKNGYAEVARAYILYRQQRAELRAAKAMLGVTDDLKLNINAIRVLQRRYLLRDEQGNIIETPSQLFRRVAKAVAVADKLYAETSDIAATEEEFYSMMANLEFVPNSPTMMNAGTPLGQLAACFVIPVEDSMVGIFESLKTMALIHQSGGGTGFSFSKLRPSGDIVKSTKGVASGPVSFMRVFDVSTDVIKQGGKRRGANMGVLQVDHPDILEFITAKVKEDALVNFNISVGATDAFMEAVEKDAEYDLINPRSGKVERRLSAKEVFDLIVNMAWRTGDPGIIFLDEINRHNPTPELGQIEATNPCITGDTLMATDNGLVRIDKLNTDCKVLTMNNNFHEHGWVGKTGVKEVFRVKTKAGYEVSATSDHKFLTNSGTWKRLEELTKGDKLVLGGGAGFGKLHVDKEVALMLGWLVGDGCVTEKYEDVIFNFNVGEKLELLPSFKKYLDKLNGREVKPIKYGNEIRLKYSSKIAKIFRELGAKPSSGESKTIPDRVFEMGRNSVKGFLSALFGADGSVQGNRQKGVSIRLASNSLPLLQQVQLLLLQFDIQSRIYETRRGARWKDLPDSKRRPKKYFCKPEHELVITRKSMFKFMEEIGFCVSQKNSKFANIKPSKIYRDNVALSVEKVERIGMQNVYDLHEPVTHSFSANGLIVHNCGEVPLLSYESCILGSINLAKMVKDGNIDWEKLKKMVRSAVHFLDNVIDVNKYPIPDIEKMTKLTRKIGLGIMGFAEMLLDLGIPYDTEQALAKAEEIMKFISEEGRKMSVELAESRGSFPAFPGSLWEKRGYRSLRNATVTTIAPTGTISIIAGTTSGIEPLFAVAYIRNVMSGIQLIEVNQTFERIATKRGFYSRELMVKLSKLASIKKVQEIPEDVRKVFVTAFDVTPDWHVRMQAVFQKYVDNAVSKTINLPNEATPEDVRRAYMLAYDLRCKGITIYRYGSKAKQVLSITPQSALALPEEKYMKAEPDYSGGRPTGEENF